jgi:alcohol dehydrogenase (cytochrome c)
MPIRAVTSAVLLLVAGSLGCGRERATRPDLPIRAVTDARLDSAAADAWLSYGRDRGNTRYVPLTEINHGTVGSLRKLWQHKPGTLLRRHMRNESTPIVVDGMLIYTDINNLVMAVDVRSGEEQWRYKPDLGPAALCCGTVNRGVAVYGDKVYLASLDARVIALDRRTGKVVWDVKAATTSEGYSFTMAPLAADGKIIVGASGGEFGARGFVDAYDPATGKRLWRFWTVPGPAEGGWYGQWSSTTPDGEPLPRDIAREKRDSAKYAEAWRRGGAGMYSTPAYDAQRGLIIAATGNPSAVDGVIPSGDNLYSTSLVAIDVRTGKLQWYYQVLPHNLWDFDNANPPVLIDVPVGDSTLPLVGAAGKTGWLYLLDRRTGRQVRRSDAFIPLENIFPTPTREGVRTSPGTRGGANWAPPAYSPRTGLFYVLGSYAPMMFTSDSATGDRPGPERFKGARFTALPDSVSYGTLSAIDVRTGAIRWQARTPRNGLVGGVLATEGDLVFYSDIQGYLNALDAATGRTLWRDRAGKSPLSPPISFQVDGHQHLAVCSWQGLAMYGLQ